jgi:hypothetical protein
MSHAYAIPTEQTIQRDVANAFSMCDHKVFRRENAQIYAIVGCNPDLKIISDVWFDRFDHQAEFRRVYTHLRNLIVENGYRFWLADMRFMASNFAGSKDWFVGELMPAVFAGGLKRKAVVLPDAVLQEEGADVAAVVSQALSEIADGRLRGFTDIALAKRWLLDGKLPGG